MNVINNLICIYCYNLIKYSMSKFILKFLIIYIISALLFQKAFGVDNGVYTGVYKIIYAHGDSDSKKGDSGVFEFTIKYY